MYRTNQLQHLQVLQAVQLALEALKDKACMGEVLRRQPLHVPVFQALQPLQAFHSFH